MNVRIWRTCSLAFALLANLTVSTNQSVAEVLPLPLTGGWDRTLKQSNGLECKNAGENSVRALLIVEDPSGKAITRRKLAVEPGSTSRISLDSLIEKQLCGATRKSCKRARTYGTYLLLSAENGLFDSAALSCRSIITEKDQHGKRTAIYSIDAEPVVRDRSARSYALPDGSICDPDLRPLGQVDGNWTVRWGRAANSTVEPPISSCTRNSRSQLLYTGTLNAVALEWKEARTGSSVRTADVSFTPSSMANYSHVALFPHYNPSNLSRIGIAVFGSTIYVQCNAINTGCKTSSTTPSTQNLFPSTGGQLSSALVAGRWYRIHAEMRRSSTGLTVSGNIKDLNSGGAIIGTVSQFFPNAYTPLSSYTSTGDRWGIGYLGTTTNAVIRVDDFIGLAR